MSQSPNTSLPENHYMVIILGACNSYCIFLVIRLTRMYYGQCCVTITFIIFYYHFIILFLQVLAEYVRTVPDISIPLNSSSRVPSNTGPSTASRGGNSALKRGSVSLQRGSVVPGNGSEAVGRGTVLLLTMPAHPSVFVDGEIKLTLVSHREIFSESY